LNGTHRLLAYANYINILVKHKYHKKSGISVTG